MMEPQKKILVQRIISIILCSLMAIGALAVFGYEATRLIRAIINRADILIFDKGAMYLMGCGLSAGLMTFFFVYEVLDKKISASLNRIGTVIGLGCVLSIFIMPQVVHFGVTAFVTHNNYKFCPKQSFRGLKMETLIYTADGYHCEKYKGRRADTSD